MSEAWKILAALTFARLSMGFQFQAIPALAAPLTGAGGMSFTALGSLTGAYLLPGVIAAMAGGWLGQRVGDIRVALLGLALMALGGLGGWLAEAFGTALFFRLLAGVGAVGLNVMLTKMAADWFQGRTDLPTAMGVLVSSWPAGIALAMLVLPPVAATFGLGAALVLPATLSGACCILLAAVWRAPRRVTAAPTARAVSRLSAQEGGLVILAGTIWGLYNVALIAAIAWTPDLLRSMGIDAVAASAAASLIGWSAIVSVAAGGWLASRAPHRDIPALVSFALSGALLLMIVALGAGAASAWVMLAVGIAIGPAAAVIMTLPVEAARPELRSLAMGLYLAVYYAAMGVAPAILGALRDATADAATPLYVAAALLLACILLWAAFRHLQRRGGAASAAP